MSESQNLESVLDEHREFPPPARFSELAHIKSPADYDKLYAESLRDPEGFWARAASELHWFKKWDRVLSSKDAPFYRWFDGGRTNLAYNCLDRHLSGPIRNKAAIVWEGEPGDSRVLTYWDLAREVQKFAAALEKLGINRGDRVAIYLPMVPELVVAVLACARIGAVHTVIFAGFSAESIKDRVLDCTARLVITADGGWRRGQVLPLKTIVDDAVAGCDCVRDVIVVKRGHGDPFPCHIKEGRDHWYHRLMDDAPATHQAAEMESEDMLFLLYTSGTTGKPKGIIHTTGGYMTFAYHTARHVFDLRPEDVYWCTADIGWITGHSYVIYGPLANGATCLLYEGAPNFPDNGRLWQLVEKYGVTIFYTAPTAIRAFMKWGDKWPQRHDLSSLRLLGTVGEPINPEAWIWYNKTIGGQRCPIVDTWWQTETGGIMITPLPGATVTRPGSATRPYFGIDAAVLDESGQPAHAGFLAIRKPWQGMLRGIYGDPERYRKTYWSKWKDIYFPGDGARTDERGYFWIVGRVDDVVNVAGHRIGTAELESIFVEHPAVAEAAVIGVKHDLKGQSMVAFVTLRENHGCHVEKLEVDLVDLVVKKIGKFATPDRIIWAADLPKTRSGKIMRRLLRDIADGSAMGNVATLADPTVLETLKKHYEED